MSQHVIKDPQVTINGVDLSDDVKSVSIPYAATIQDAVRSGHDTEAGLPGLKSWTLTIEFYQNYDAAKVDATLFPLVGADEFPVKVRHKDLAIAATNPSYEANGVLESYDPVKGTVGDVHMSSVSIKPGYTTANTLIRRVA